MNALTPITTFAFRTTICGTCGGSGAFSGTYSDIICNDCGGQGQWDASCDTCGEIRPLDNFDTCANCSGFVEVEHLGPGRIAA